MIRTSPHLRYTHSTRLAPSTSTPSQAQGGTCRSLGQTTTTPRQRPSNRSTTSVTYITELFVLFSISPAHPTRSDPNGTARSYLERLDGEKGKRCVQTAHGGQTRVVVVGSKRGGWTIHHVRFYGFRAGEKAMYRVYSQRLEITPSTTVKGKPSVS